MIRVGDKLRDERKRQGYTLEEVAKATRIRIGFLQAIESGDYKSLPSSAYVQGFVKNYVEFLGLPSKELLALFRREFNEKEHLGVLPESFTSPKDIAVNQVRIRQTIALVGIVLLSLVVYVFFQYRAAFFAPALSVDSPKENATIASQALTISGKTEPNTIVTVNGFPAVVDDSGNFKKEITVFSGPTTITIKAVNSFEKTTIVERHITIK